MSSWPYSHFDGTGTKQRHRGDQREVKWHWFGALIDQRHVAPPTCKALLVPAERKPLYPSKS